MDDSFQLIKSSHEVLQKLYELVYFDISPKVAYIIDNNIKDEYIIEQLLAKLLNIPTERCKALFMLLCEYVSEFNEEVADDYLGYYHELYNDDLKNPKLTKKKELKNNIDMI